MKIKILIFAIFLVIVSCKPRNKLNTDEQKLASQIKTEEQEKLDTEKTSRENTVAMSDSLPPGFRFQENRSIDPQNPPEIINIAGNLENKKEIKLSNIAKSIRYIRLASPPDSVFYQSRLQVIFTKSNIIATSHLGTCVYTLSGEFVDIIGTNEFDPPPGIPPPHIPKNDPYFSRYNNSPKELKKFRENHRGVQNKGITDIYENNYSGATIYFKYRDKAKKESYLMKYNVNDHSASLLMPGSDENKDQIISKGDKIVSLDDKSTFEYQILDKNTKIGYQQKWNSARNGIMLLLQTIKGDTLCVFKEYDRITNYDATIVRGVESGSKYFYKNQFTYRSAFNDTIFRLILPNRLLPVFLLNFGEHTLTAMEAINPHYDLTNKFLINSWIETPDYIFIRYTKGRSTIYSRVHKTVNYYYAVYDKKLKEIYHLPIDTLNYVYEIENNIDGGLPVWPENITTDGKIYKTFEGWEIKNHVKSKEFIQSKVPHEMKETLKRLADSAGDAETIVMILE